jgi:hypothetical protein
MNRVQGILFYLVDQVTTSLLLLASMPVLEGCSEGSLCLPVLQAQDAVLLKKCKLVCCVLCSQRHGVALFMFAEFVIVL